MSHSSNMLKSKRQSNVNRKNDKQITIRQIRPFIPILFAKKKEIVEIKDMEGGGV